MRRRAAPALVVASLLALAGCGGAPGRDDQATVLAASSLRAVFERTGAHLDRRPAFSFAASSRLVTQVRDGAPADVVATADQATMAVLARAGLLAGPPVPFATNRLAIAVAPRNPEGVRSLADLTRPGLRVVLAAPSVPAGRYTAAALSRAGVAVRPVSLEDDVAAVAARVERGEADAGVVYVTDVRARPGLAAVAIPDAQNVRARYPIALVRAGRHPAAGRRFLALVRSPAGQRLLADAGFGPP
jgi:molybdate transport system substrate-binding protein